MLLERPLSLKQIFHYYTQINQQRDRIIRMQQLTYNFFFLSFLFSVAGLFLFFFFFRFTSFNSSIFLCSFFFLFFLRRSVPFPSFFFFFFFASLFLFFLFTSFHTSILLCPLRCCRVVMLKTAVYGS